MSKDFNQKLLLSLEIKKVVDFVKAEYRSSEETEIRMVIRPDGSSYAHVLNRDSSTIDFDFINTIAPFERDPIFEPKKTT